MSVNTKKFFNENDPSTYHLPVKDTRFNLSFQDRVYTETSGSFKDGTYENKSRIMSVEETKEKLANAYKGMGMEMEGGGFLPNVGKKYVDTAAGIAGGIESLNNKDGNPLDQVLSASGMNRDDAAFAINSQLEGTDAHYMSQVAKSINLNVDQQRGVTTVIQPVINNVEVPTPVPQPTPVPLRGKTNTVFLDSSNNNTLAKLIR